MSRRWLSFTPNLIPFVSIRLGADRYEAMVASPNRRLHIDFGKGRIYLLA
jgi:hypothetical protein